MLLIHSMYNRLSNSSAGDTVDLDKPYTTFFPYTHVVAVVPINTEQGCAIEYNPEDIKHNGPYVFQTTLNFEHFFKSGLSAFF